ncbi:MAG: MMPL family transporter [Planctomycetota bacterium]
MTIVEHLVDLAIRFRTLLLALCFALVAAAYVPSTGLQFERSVENLFRKDDPRYENYRLDQKLFGGIESAVVAYDDPQLFTFDGLVRLVSLEATLERVEGVASVTGLNEARRPSALLDGRKLIEQVQAGDISPEELKQEIIDTDLYRGRLISADGETALLLVEFDTVSDDPQVRADAVAEIYGICGEHTPEAQFIGGPVLVEEVYRTLEYDGVLLGLASSLILTLVVAIMFRSVRWTLLPLAIVHVSLIWTKAILALYGAKLSMVSAPLVAMVTVIGVATAVHVMIRYREEREKAEPEEALRKALVHILPAIFWTCLTTAAGFAALFACSISPIQTFAAMMSLGSMLVFVATVMLVPGAALIMKTVDTRPGSVPGEQSVTGMLSGTVSLLRKYPGRVVFALALFLAFLSAGVSRLSVATNFTDNFRSNSPLVQAYDFLRTRIGSLETLDIVVDVPDPMSRDFEGAIDEIRELQTALESSENVVDTVSFVDLLDFISGKNEVVEEDGGIESWLPSIDIVPDRAQLMLLDTVQPGIVAGFWNRDENAARIIVQMKHVPGTDEKVELIEQIESTSQEKFDSAKIAGYFVLLANVVQSLLADQWTTFALSIIAIFVIMSVAFRSISLGVVALIPNAVPIITVIGAMGWLGLEINIATAMMASVSMGLSADFSIHYLYRFNRELRDGKDFFAAMRSAHGSVGLAMVIANLALIAGFLVLTLSSLVPSVHFGLMVSVTMLGGLLGNLVILPLLLRLLWGMGLIKERIAVAASSEQGS